MRAGSGAESFMESAPPIRQAGLARIIAPLLVGAFGGAALGLAILVMKIPWSQPRAPGTWPTWIALPILGLPAAVGGAWVGGFLGWSVGFAQAVRRGEASRRLRAAFLVVTAVWLAVTAWVGANPAVRALLLGP